ncbi:MAG: helix-turn-helix transcriptional regulator [Clostridia bacterium]|nr:helix-turn-helix transcriptional regulator [Clostridia bacterium]
MTIVQRIKNLAQEQGISVTYLCKKIGLSSRTYFNDIEKHGREIPLDKLTIIAEALHTTVAYLKGETKQKKPSARTLSLADALTPREISVAIAYRTHPNEQAAVDKLLDVPSGDDELTVYIAAHFGRADSEGYKTMTGAEWAELESTPETDQDLT